MRKVLKWRYYCEFCKKSGMAASHIKRHEVSCTGNPDRFCRFCVLAGIQQKPLLDLIEVFKRDGVDALRTAAENCPACMLTAIRHSGVNGFSEDDEDGRGGPLSDKFHPDDFNFKQEKEAFWRRYNDARIKEEYP